MELFLSAQSIEFLGDEIEGAQAGDRRILVNRLHDEEGNDLGESHIVTTVVAETSDGSHLLTATGTVIFPTGRIYVASSGDIPDAADETIAVGGHWAIVGGTEEFAHATGWITSAPPEHEPSSLGDWTVTVDIECDD
ncbi:MAG: hypothetical protein AAF414_16290 [Pseudomonadota bacterium]